MKKEKPRFVPYADDFDHTPVWPSGVPFPVKIVDGEARHEMETRGMYGGVSKISGLAISKEYEDRYGQYTETGKGVMVYGKRSLNNPRESGYQMEGRVSIGGKNYSAFTGSQLFFVNGKLVDVGTLHVRVSRAKKVE
jgi:hypothetical protein